MVMVEVFVVVMLVELDEEARAGRETGDRSEKEKVRQGKDRESQTTKALTHQQQPTTTKTKLV